MKNLFFLKNLVVEVFGGGIRNMDLLFLIIVGVPLISIVFVPEKKQETCHTNLCHEYRYKLENGKSIENPFYYTGNKRMMISDIYPNGKSEWSEWRYFDRYERKDGKHYYDKKLKKYVDLAYYGILS